MKSTLRLTTGTTHTADDALQARCPLVHRGFRPNLAWAWLLADWRAQTSCCSVGVHWHCQCCELQGAAAHTRMLPKRLQPRACVLLARVLCSRRRSSLHGTPRAAVPCHLAACALQAAPLDARRALRSASAAAGAPGTCASGLRWAPPDPRPTSAGVATGCPTRCRHLLRVRVRADKVDRIVAGLDLLRLLVLDLQGELVLERHDHLHGV